MSLKYVLCKINDSITFKGETGDSKVVIWVGSVTMLITLKLDFHFVH